MNILSSSHARRTRRWWAAFSALALLANAACKPAERPLSPRELLVGEWQLDLLGNRPLANTSVAAWTIAFFADGTWRGRGSLRGTWAGLAMNTGGTWVLNGNTLQCRVGKAADVQTSIVSVSPGELTLTPDPVLANPGGKPVASTYKRLRKTHVAATMRPRVAPGPGHPLLQRRASTARR